MNPLLNEIHSIINGYNNAKDKERVFTYIEFVKQFGYDNDTNIFISAYKDYVTQWGIVKKDSITLSDEEFVMKKMIDVLKSITLDYSSYEEQDFIAHIDLKDKEQLKGLCALYSRKIREITEFYRKKRNESSLIVQRNSAKGSVKSVQEVIYEKIFDFIFSNRNIVPSYKNIKRDLIVSVENYVDTYSEYFDIPRQKEFTDKSRAEMLSANINDVDYRVYIEIQLVVSEILFSGKVWLEEIPLIANIGADLSAECVGDMLMLKNQLMENTTVNLVDLNEQVALKRRFYEKFLGCDLYYLYVDLQGNVKIDRLCKAQNPTGNLLNCGTADTATVENEQLKLLSQIGLFFKPDKTSILKIGSEKYTWDIDRDNLINDTVYVFPDPDKYGDIGNNKNPLYPLIMRCELDYELKNASSSFAEHDPLVLITDQGWYSYYSKQQDDFKVIDNKNYEYSLTSLANSGFIKSYKTDIWGNEFGILTGYTVAKDGDKITVTLNPKYNEGGMKYDTFDLKQSEGPILLNGGYFEDPLSSSSITSTSSSTPFNFKRRLTLIDTDDDKYFWSGIITNNEGFTHPTDTNFISFGEFGCHEGITYHDHFGKSFDHYNKLPEDNINNETVANFFSHNVYDNKEVDIIFEEKAFDEIEGGELFVKLVGQKPKKFQDIFNWDKVKLNGEEKVVDISIVTKTIVVETNKRFLFIPYDYDGESIIDTLGIKELYEVNKEEKYIKSELLYNETDKCFYLLLMEKLDCGSRRFLVPRIYQFNVEKYKMRDILYSYDCVCSDIFVDEKIDKIVLFSERMEKKDYFSEQYNSNFQYVLTSGKSAYDNLSNFEIPHLSDINDISFSYNSKIGLYLISYTVNDLNGTPYVYEHKFKLGNIDTFTETLISKVYSLKGGDDESFKWNDTPKASEVSTIPYNTKSKTLNTIWEEYIGEGNANEGFVQTESDLSKKDFNSSNKNWKSYVYNWDGFNYSLSKTRKVTGGFEFINGKGKITSFDNELKFRYYNLFLDGKADDGRNWPLSTQCVDECNEITINVKRDLLGNLQGDNTTQLVKITPTAQREITGEISLKIRGTSTNPEITVTVIVRDYLNNSLTWDDDGDDGNKDVFEDEKNNIKVYIHSEVRDYDNINKETTATANVKKALAITENQWKVTFNGNGGKPKIGKNDCTLSIDRLKVVPCTEERKGNNKDIPKTISTTGEYVELILNQGTTENNKFNFELDITNGTDNVKEGKVYVTENPKTLKLMDSSLDSLDDYSKMVLKGEDAIKNLPTYWENEDDAEDVPRHFTLGYEKSYFDGEKLHLHLYGTMYLNTCQYNCWIAYDKNGVPIRFKLDTMRDMNSLFTNTAGTGLSWTFTGEDVPNSNEDGDSHMILSQTTEMPMAFQGSDVSRIRLQNDILVQTRQAFSNCLKLFDFSITTSDKEIKPLSKVISARGMFNSYTAPNLERVKNRYKISGLKNDKYGTNDPRYYAEWCNIVENACEANKILFEQNRELSATETSTWKTNCWIKALDNLADRNESFCYDMDELREANFMFHGFSQVTDSEKTWDDENNNDDTVVSKKRYTISDNIYQFSAGKPLDLIKEKQERQLDFEKIEVRTPKLLSGVGMFWNRPLTVAEAKIFANSLRDLNEQVELDEEYKINFWAALGVKQSTLSYKEAFDTYMSKEFDVSVINKITGKTYSDSTETDKITAFRNYIINDSCSPFRQKDVYMYPSISIFIDTNTKNGYNETTAQNVIKTIAKKGWEVSTNIYCTDVVSKRNTTLVAKKNTTTDPKNEDYYIRAYEFAGSSGMVRFTDKEYYNTHSERQDYFIDFCKSVVNPITCEDRNAWLKLCLLWNRASLGSSRVSWKSSVGMQQILGEATKHNKISGYSDATLYVKGEVNGSYSATWYNGTADDFMRQYNLREA